VHAQWDSRVLEVIIKKGKVRVNPITLTLTLTLNYRFLMLMARLLRTMMLMDNMGMDMG